jgi:hypothetical protein
MIVAGHIDADLDDRGGDQKIAAVTGEIGHRPVLVGALHAAVDEPDATGESGQRANALYRSSAAARSVVSDSSTIGQTQ